MKNAVVALVIGALLVPLTAASAPERAKRPTAEAPVVTGQPVKPKRMEKTPYYSRAATTPDVNQHMTWGQFIDQLPVKPPSVRMKYMPPKEIDLNWRIFEQNYCGPAAVANNLMWLDQHHFPQISDESNALAGGVFLARQLGGDAYFSTMNEPGNPSGEDPEFHLSEGTGSTFEDMINGTVKFLKEKKVPVKEVRWISPWAAPEAKSKLKLGGVPLVMERRVPKLAEVESVLRTRSIIVQIFGSYEFTVGEATENGVKPDTLVRTGGHYLAPVGFGLDENGKLSELAFAYHDSASDKQDKQTEHFYTWLKATGQYKDLPLRSFRDGGAKYASLACKNEKKGWECLGRLSDTYVRDKQVEAHQGNERIRVLEGMMVILL